MTDPNALLDEVNKSGFPLQIAIANDVRAAHRTHGWTVMFDEHAWKHPDGTSGYIDLVLENTALATVLLVECKRLQMTSMTFLSTGGVETQTNRASAYEVVRRPNGLMHSSFPAWVDMLLVASSPEVGFCVVRRKGGNRDPTIETVGSQLVAAAEALAEEESGRRPSLQHERSRKYFSIIVTTADLWVCDIDPAEISLVDGTMSSKAKFESAHSVRFRKQLTTRHAIVLSPPSLRRSEGAALAHAKERTVFVVQARHFQQFLRNFEFARCEPYYSD